MQVKCLYLQDNSLDDEWCKEFPHLRDVFKKVPNYIFSLIVSIVMLLSSSKEPAICTLIKMYIL